MELADAIAFALLQAVFGRQAFTLGFQNRERDRFRLVTGDNKEHRADNAEDLTEQALGWRLPLAGLADWVQARSSPGRPAEMRGGPDSGLELRQDGWRVLYEEFREGKPFRMRLTREDLEIRLIVDQWTN